MNSQFNNYMKHFSVMAFAILSTVFFNRVHAQANCAAPNTGLTPFLDLQTGYYLGYQAGLYPGGTNILTGPHLKSGKSIAKSIKPLDGSGNVNYGDGVVLIAGFGPSIAGHIYSKVIDKVRNPSGKYDLNPCLDAINLCIGGKDIEYATDDSTFTNYWEGLVDDVYSVGYTPYQVQIGWMYFNTKGLYAPPVFPDNALEIKDLYIKFLNRAKEYFPNLKIMYVSARHYGGYADTSIVEYYSLAEPASYQNNWTVKWMIEDQINNVNPMLKYKGANAKAPFTLWGPNFWCDGDLVREYDHKSYECEFSFDPDDGYHLTDPQDSRDASDILDLIYFGDIGNQFAHNSVTWATCIPWLDSLAERNTEELEVVDNMRISPNPGVNDFYLSLPDDLNAAEITILDATGREVEKFLHEDHFSGEVFIDMQNHPSGMYFVKVNRDNKITTLRFIKQ